MIIQQQTLSKGIEISGVGLHSGELVNMRLLPAEVDTGVVFKRMDLNPVRTIKLSPFNVTEALLCTLLVSPEDDRISVSTIEHLMSALCVFGIDNVVVELDRAELPVMDGSSRAFVDAFNKTGLVVQAQVKKQIKILKTVRVEEADKFAEISPSEQTHYRFEIKWDHPVIASTPVIAEFSGDKQTYIDTIASARTFGFVEQLDYLHRNNLAKGASLDNAVGVTDEGVANNGGLRYPDEFVKHKLLDAIGDFYAGGVIIGYFNCYKSGHALNNKLLRSLFSDQSAWQYI